MKIRIAPGYDPDIYDFTADDFDAIPGVYWCEAFYQVDDFPTFAMASGHLMAVDGDRVTLRDLAGIEHAIHAVSLYVTGDYFPLSEPTERKER